jgi:hypothetical protein
MSLTDALDDLISEGRIAPQLAMKILSNFDRTITEVLADKVKANLTFKVCFWPSKAVETRELNSVCELRATWTRTASATKFGPF